MTTIADRTSTTTRKGGSWLLDDTTSSDVFTPEKLSEEHRLMARTTTEFVDVSKHM